MSDNGRTDALKPDRMAPHSIEAEEAVLGSVLLNDDDWFLVADMLTADDFFIYRNGWIWAAFQRIKARGGSIDNVTVVEELRQSEQLEEAGGAAYVTYLINHTPSGIYTETYADIIERAAVRRRLLSAASEIAQHANAESATIDETIGNCEKALFTATQQRTRRNDALLRDVLVEHSSEMSQRAAQSETGKVFGVPSGFKALDDLMGGFEKDYLIYLAGRPGMGKTSLMLNCAVNAARAGARVGFFSMEMSKMRLTRRLIAMETGISTGQQRRGDLSDEAWALYYEAQDRLSKLPIILDASPKLTPQAMRNKARRWYGEYGLDIIFADYIGLMTVPGMSPDNRNALVTEISSSCMALVRELNVPLVMASQLSRALENRKDKRPMLSDLRDSGSLEQDGDVVIFIYRDQEYNPDTEYQNQAEIIVAKNRDGATGMVRLFFRKELTQFADLAKTDNLDLRGYSPNTAENYVGRGAKD